MVKIAGSWKPQPIQQFLGKEYHYPTDNKLHCKIIKICIAIADKEDIELRQSYTRTLTINTHSQK